MLKAKRVIEKHFTLFYDVVKEHSMVLIEELATQARSSADPVAFLKRKKGEYCIHVQHINFHVPQIIIYTHEFMHACCKRLLFCENYIRKTFLTVFPRKLF